jgi:hypothetical protein
LAVADEFVTAGQDIAAIYRRPHLGQPAAAARAITEIEWLAAAHPYRHAGPTSAAAG